MIMPTYYAVSQTLIRKCRDWPKSLDCLLMKNPNISCHFIWLDFLIGSVSSESNQCFWISLNLIGRCFQRTLSPDWVARIQHRILNLKPFLRECPDCLLFSFLTSFFCQPEIRIRIKIAKSSTFWFSNFSSDFEMYFCLEKINFV